MGTDKPKLASGSVSSYTLVEILQPLLQLGLRLEESRRPNQLSPGVVRFDLMCHLDHPGADHTNG